MYQAWNFLLNYELFKEGLGRIYIAEYTDNQHLITWKGCLLQGTSLPSLQQTIKYLKIGRSITWPRLEYVLYKMLAKILNTKTNPLHHVFKETVFSWVTQNLIKCTALLNAIQLTYQSISKIVAFKILCL